MKISIVGPTYPFRGGIAQHTTILCNTLRRKHDVQFISYTRQYPKMIFPGKTDQDPSENALRADPVEYLIDSMNPYTWYQGSRAIREFGPDRVIFPWWVIFWAPQILYLAKKVGKEKKAKRIFICHNVAEHETNGIKERINKHVLQQGDVLITQSKEETRKLKGIVSGECRKVRILTGFHPTYADLCVMPRESEETKKECPELLFFGFVRKYKGLDVLLEALAKVITRRKVILRIVGEFWKDKEGYLEKIKELEIENYIQIVDEYVPNEELGRYFHAADLVIQPYLSASGSGVSQLAYGFGKPVIATNVGSIGEVIMDKINGRLVDPGDADGLSTAILESLEREELSRMNIEAKKVKDRFSWSRFADTIATC